MPCQNGFIANQVYLAIGKTLASVNIGAPRFQVITANPLRRHGDRKQPHEASNH
jgi:hypothetical protein